MDKNAIRQAAEARAAVVNAGAAAARGMRHRTENPYAADSPEWLDWSEGYDQQAAWLETGRGVYHVGAGTALAPRG